MREYWGMRESIEVGLRKLIAKYPVEKFLVFWESCLFTA